MADKLPLSTTNSGDLVQICSLDKNEQSHRLRELGIIEGKSLKVIQNSDKIICQVGECKFGICKKLARCILVELYNAENKGDTT